MATSKLMPSSISLFSTFHPSSSQPHTPFLPKSFFKPPKSLPSITQSRPLTIRAEAATLPILSFDGEKIGETTLDIKSARPETARAVVHRGIVTDLRNRRRGTASTLTRAEVRGGGRKPYAQKKTGHARRGSQRTPLRPGGGVIFGPKPRDWSIKINRKEKRLAISTALASAAVNGIVVEDFGDKFEEPKTKEFISVLKRWGIDPSEKSMFLMMDISDNLNLSSRNIGTCKVLTPRTLNLFDILNADKLVFTKDALEYLNDEYGYGEYEEGDFEEEGEFESEGEAVTETETEGEAETEAESEAEPEGTETEGDAADASTESEGEANASE